MKFVNLFNKEFLVEETSKIRKNLKIYYKLDLNLKKIQKDIDNSQEENQQEIDNQQNIQQPQQVEPENLQNQPVENNTIVQQPQQIPLTQDQSQIPMPAMSSVVTEDDINIVNSDNIIIRKIDGETSLDKNQNDKIQSMQDIIDILGETKKDGVNILDEFTTEILNLLLTPQAQQISSKVDKSSSIYAEIIYGYNKDDSIGVRLIKRKNSDSVTMTMLVDNEIINTPVTLSKIDQKVIEFRNYEQNNKGEN